MKIKLTPSLAYFIGLWKERRTVEGIGVKGPEEIQAAFVHSAIENKLAEPGKILAGEESIYFYHTAQRKFFQKVIEEELERFKYKNEYSANFLAGIFDGCGGTTAGGKVYLAGIGKADQMMLSRLGFNLVKIRGAFFITRPAKFLILIKPFTRVHKDNEIFSKITADNIRDIKALRD